MGHDLSQWIYLGGVKAFADGSLGSNSALLYEVITKLFWHLHAFLVIEIHLLFPLPSFLYCFGKRALENPELKSQNLTGIEHGL